MKDRFTFIQAYLGKNVLPGVAELVVGPEQEDLEDWS